MPNLTYTSLIGKDSQRPKHIQIDQIWFKFVCISTDSKRFSIPKSCLPPARNTFRPHNMYLNTVLIENWVKSTSIFTTNEWEVYIYINWWWKSKKYSDNFLMLLLTLSKMYTICLLLSSIYIDKRYVDLPNE